MNKELISHQTDISIGEIIKTERKRKKYSCKEISAALGITPGVYSKYETEKFEQSVLLALKIADFLGFSWEDVANADTQEFEYDTYVVKALSSYYVVGSSEGELITSLPLSYSKSQIETWIDGYKAGVINSYETSKRLREEVE